MKKISYYLLLIVFIGVAIVSFWVYQKYFKLEIQSVIAFQVARGNLLEIVSVRGEVASQKELDLEFPFGGIIEHVYAKEGERVKESGLLMKLETKELDLEKNRLNAILSQEDAILAKLLGGAQEEDMLVFESKVTAGEQALNDAKKSLLDTLEASFTSADDAIYNKGDQFFNNPRAPNATFNQVISDSQLETNLEIKRIQVEVVLLEWRKALPFDITRVSIYAKRTQERLAFIRSFLLDLATAVNGITATGSISQATIDGWKMSLLLARTNVDTAISAVVVAEEKVRAAESALALAQSELVFKKSKPRSEDVKIAEAQIEQTKSALAIIDEKIRKSTLRAPGAGVVKKILTEEREVFKPGMPALVFASEGFKVQADVSELDISKVRYVNGSDADIRFDSFPGKVFVGKVVFIEPREIIKNEDIYFRTNIFIKPNDDKIEIRSGMSADVVLHGVLKKNVLSIPELAVNKRGGSSFVNVAIGAKTKEEVDTRLLEERPVITGISDGESFEVISGVTEGEIVVVSND